MINQSELRLSAVRAMLGRIYPEMRLVKVKAVDQNIVLSVALDREPGDALREDVSIAAAEIIADFPEATRIEEIFCVHSDPISAENVVAEGWIYRRAE